MKHLYAALLMLTADIGASKNFWWFNSDAFRSIGDPGVAHSEGDLSEKISDSLGTAGNTGDSLGTAVNVNTFVESAVTIANNHQNVTDSSRISGNFFFTTERIQITAGAALNTGDSLTTAAASREQTEDSFLKEENSVQTNPTTNGDVVALKGLPEEESKVEITTNIQNESSVSVSAEIDNNIQTEVDSADTDEDPDAQIPSPGEENTVGDESVVLPETECPYGMRCVQSNYCDNNTEVSNVFIENIDKHRKLIACMNLELRMLGVCCNILEPLDGVEDYELPSEDLQLPSEDHQLDVDQNVVQGNVLPVTLGLYQESCESLEVLPPVEQCSGRLSECWNVGSPDADCPQSSLCCYDGCANICRRNDSLPSVSSASTRRTTPQPNLFTSQPKVLRTTRPPVRTFGFVPATLKPYIRCPSSMNCIQRDFCDFNGVMTNEIVQSTALMERLRVPLIPCVNRQRGNSIDVCCRVP